MLTGQLPLSINPRKLAHAETRIAGSILVTDLSRFAEAILDPSGEVALDLQFLVDEEGFYVVQGTLSIEVKLTCQRCLQVMRLPLSVTCNLAIVWHEEAAKAVPAHYDPVIVAETNVALTDLVEDELILALPIVARHELTECHFEGNVEASDPDGGNAEANTPSRENPFQVLASLKTDT
ncbi:YceD family protein [Zooshikella sp. RANM57]|uniref:YceD family protein n=1 Tax=Zooshikella sp. RANM57 TaxID=3425863 RepID=UPI003D6E9A9B